MREVSEIYYGTPKLLERLGGINLENNQCNAEKINFYSLYEIIDNPEGFNGKIGVSAIAVRNYLFIGVISKDDKSACLICLVNAILRNNPDCFTDVQKNDSISLNTDALYNGFSPSLLSLAISIGNQIHSTPPLSEYDPTWIWRIDGRTLDIQREGLLPVTNCSSCNSKAATDIEDRIEGLQESLMQTHSNTRARSLDALEGSLSAACIGQTVGVVQDYVYDLQMPFGACAAWSPIRIGRREPTLGRAVNFKNARTIALIESLERNAGLFGGLNKNILKASYNDISEDAINPVEIGLHPDALYDEEGYRFSRIDPANQMSWVRGTNLTKNRKVWVPYCFSFYGPSPSEPALAYETSNGCATGSNYAEATLHGLFELVERDSFLLHWYGQLSPFKFSLDFDRMEKLKPLLNRIELFTGCKIDLFDTTMEHGIPSVMALISNDNKVGPITACAAGAGITFLDASRAALFELAGHYLRMVHNFQDKDLVRELEKKFNEPNLVLTMEDHGLVNALPQAVSNFNNIISGAEHSNFNVNPLDGVGDTPTQVLNSFIERLQQHGFDVIVVDQSTKALDGLNLRAVKVIVPGLIPMTFGHIHRRTKLKRLEMYNDEQFKPHPFP